jgi:hypothetical protein
MSVLYDRGDDHFDPALLRSSIVITACSVMITLVVVWIWFSGGSTLLRITLTGAVIVSALSAFTAGNTFRLRDIRARIGNQVRAGRRDKKDVLATLPPRQTIARRFSLAAMGAVLGAVALLLTLLIAQVESRDIKTTAAVSILSVVCAVLCFVGGTFVRPID